MNRIFTLLKNKSILIILVLIILSLQIPLITPLLRSGYFPNHDDVQVVRVFEIFQSIQYGDFPPRWSAGLLYGHGYPVFVFYSPFAYLIAALFVLGGFTFLTAVKLTFIASFFIGSVGMFFCARALWGNRAGFLSSIVYSFVPYRAVDIYVRGNIAEFFAFSFFPWIVWANIRLVSYLRSTDFEKKEVLGSIGSLNIFNFVKGNLLLFWSLILGLFIGILFISHNVSAFIYGQFLLLFNLFWLFSLSKDRRYLFMFYFGISGLFGVLLSCFFWLPLIVESKYVLLGDFKDYPYYLHFLTFSQIWSTPWGYGGFTAENPMSLQFGKIALILSFITLLMNAFIKTQWRRTIYFFGFILILFTLLETRVTESVWKTFSAILSFMQFPWRYHILTTFAAAMLSGAFLYLVDQLFKTLRNKQTIIFIGVLLIVGGVVFENIFFFVPEKYTNLPSVSETTTWNDEYLPRWVKRKPKDYAADKVSFVQGSGEFRNIHWGYLEKEFEVHTASSAAVLEIAHIYYPGWTLYVNGQKQEIDYLNDGGLMRAHISEGNHRVKFEFQRTAWRLISEIVSFVTLFILIVLLSKTWQKAERIVMRKKGKNG